MSKQSVNCWFLRLRLRTLLWMLGVVIDCASSEYFDNRVKRCGSACSPWP